MSAESPKTPQEEMEIRLLALLLGELPEEEAAAWRAAIATNPELAKRHDRLKQIVGLVREAAAIPVEPKSTHAAPLQLSEARRKKLFTRFMIPPLKERDREPRPLVQFRLVEVLSVVAVLALLAAMFLPALSKSKSRAQHYYALRSVLGTPSETSEEISAAASAAPPPDSAALESTLRPAANFNKYLEQGQQRPSESKSEGERRILYDRVQIAGQPAASAMRQSDALARGVDPTTGLPVDSTAPRANIVLPAVTESAEARKGTEVTLGNEFSWRLREQNGRGFDDSRTQPGQSATLFAGDPQWTGVLEKPESSPAAKPVTAGQSGAEPTIELPRERLPEALKTAAGGAFIQPATGLAAETLARGGAIADNITPTAPEQTAFMRRYGLPPAKTAGGMGGAGGGGVASSGGVALGLQPPPSQTVPGYVVAGDAVSPLPVLGDLPAEGKLFRSEQPSSETLRFGFSLLGPKSQSNQATWGDFDSDGFRDLFYQADGVALAGKDTSKVADNEWFAGRPLAREGGVPGQLATPSPAIAAGESAVRRPAPIVLPPVMQEVAGAPAVESSEREVLARNGTVPQRQLRGPVSRAAEKPTGTTAPARADEQLLVESRLNDADADRAKNRGRISTDAARERGVADQGKKADAKAKVTDGRVLLEAGKVAESEAKLQDAIKADPQNRAAEYYLSLAKEPRLATAERRSEVDSKKTVTPGQNNLGGTVARSDQSKVQGEALKETEQLRAELNVPKADSAGNALSVEPDVAAIHKPATNAPIPQPEIQTSENNFSTFSLNVSDVSFKLAAASLEKGQMPDAASVRSEEFINAFDYRDPEPLPGAPIAFAWERARYPFAHNRDLLRFSLKTAAAGRQAGRPINIVLLLDNSGSMERADRVRIIREALRVLASQLQPQDKLSVITFARTARLVADGISGDKAGEVTEAVSGVTPQGGTNFEEGMNLAYATALRHYVAGGINRVVMLTDGAANLGDVEPESLKKKVETHRKQGVALDCFGIGWEGYNDDLLEVLSRNGDGRYGFLNSPEEAATDFAGQLAGALKVAASDVKVQVEFNPRRVTAYRQIGYAKHQLTKEQFRDNTVDAAEIAAQEAGNALYTVEVNPAGDGPLCTVRVRFRFAGTWEYREQAWDVPCTGNAVSLEQSSPALRLAASASAFSEWLVASPFAAEVTPDRLLGHLSGVPEVFGADSRPKKLEWMIRQAKSVAGK